MLYLMRTEWKKVRLPVLLVTLLLTVTACILTCTLDEHYRLWFRLDSWEIGTAFFTLLFPLFTVFPVCWNLYYERKNNFLLYVLPRVKQTKYLAAKWMVDALSAFAVLFIPYMLSALAAIFINQPMLYENNVFRHIFAEAYTQTPLLYAVFLSCWKGFIGVLIMTLGYVLSMYVKNIFVVLTGPFIYVILENLALSMLQLEKYRHRCVTSSILLRTAGCYSSDNSFCISYSLLLSSKNLCLRNSPSVVFALALAFLLPAPCESISRSLLANPRE